MTDAERVPRSKECAEENFCFSRKVITDVPVNAKTMVPSPN